MKLFFGPRQWGMEFARGQGGHYRGGLNVIGVAGCRHTLGIMGREDSSERRILVEIRERENLSGRED